jgi:hypothetical protein
VEKLSAHRFVQLWLYEHVSNQKWSSSLLSFLTR